MRFQDRFVVVPVLAILKVRACSKGIARHDNRVICQMSLGLLRLVHPGVAMGTHLICFHDVGKISCFIKLLKLDGRKLGSSDEVCTSVRYGMRLKPGDEVLLLLRTRLSISCVVSRSKVSRRSFVGGRESLVALGGVSTLAGKNGSQMISHFPMNVLIPCRSGISISCFFLFVPAIT